MYAISKIREELTPSDKHFIEIISNGLSYGTNSNWKFNTMYALYNTRAQNVTGAYIRRVGVEVPTFQDLDNISFLVDGERKAINGTGDFMVSYCKAKIDGHSAYVIVLGSTYFLYFYQQQTGQWTIVKSPVDPGDICEIIGSVIYTTVDLTAHRFSAGGVDYVFKYVPRYVPHTLVHTRKKKDGTVVPVDGTIVGVYGRELKFKFEHTLDLRKRGIDLYTEDGVCMYYTVPDGPDGIYEINVQCPNLSKPRPDKMFADTKAKCDLILSSPLAKDLLVKWKKNRGPVGCPINNYNIPRKYALKNTLECASDLTYATCVRLDQLICDDTLNTYQTLEKAYQEKKVIVGNKVFSVMVKEVIRFDSPTSMVDELLTSHSWKLSFSDEYNRYYTKGPDNSLRWLCVRGSMVAEGRTKKQAIKNLLDLKALLPDLAERDVLTEDSSLKGSRRYVCGSLVILVYQNIVVQVTRGSQVLYKIGTCPLSVSCSVCIAREPKLKRWLNLSDSVSEKLQMKGVLDVGNNVMVQFDDGIIVLDKKLGQLKFFDSSGSVDYSKTMEDMVNMLLSYGSTSEDPPDLVVDLIDQVLAEEDPFL